MRHCTLNSLRGSSRSTTIAAWGSVAVEADGKCLYCSVIGNALGKCQLVVGNSFIFLQGRGWKEEDFMTCENYTMFKFQCPSMKFCRTKSHAHFLDILSLEVLRQKTEGPPAEQLEFIPCGPQDEDSRRVTGEADPCQGKRWDHIISHSWSQGDLSDYT